jgi:carboxymethylenebutenolidase
MAVTQINVAASGGGDIPCISAFPEGGPGTGVVVVPSIFGVDDDMAMVAERLAGQGYAAVVLDPFWRDEDFGVIGHNEEGRNRAFARLDRTPFEQAFGDVTDVIEDLRSRAECNGKIAVMGFCYGGPFAIVAGAKCGTQAGISYHGSFVDKYLDSVPDVGCPLSFHWGDNDRAAPMELIENVKESFTKLNDAEVFLYPGGVEHGYMLPGHGAAYHEAAAEQSWERTFNLLEKV